MESITDSNDLPTKAPAWCQRMLQEVIFQMLSRKIEYDLGILSLCASISVHPHKTPIWVTPFAMLISPLGSIQQGTLFISYCELFHSNAASY